VRIVRHRTIPRVAWVSLVVIAVAAASLFLVFLLLRWQADKAVVSHQRDLTEALVEYKCETGHSWKAQGQVEPPTCADCGKPGYVVGSFACQEHGTFEVAARYVYGPDGSPRRSELRLTGKDWVPDDQGVVCPRCGLRLVRQREDPLREFPRKRRKPGG
jgi:hypothetical protein